jgi:hypothetical protein
MPLSSSFVVTVIEILRQFVFRDRRGNGYIDGRSLPLNAEEIRLPTTSKRSTSMCLPKTSIFTEVTISELNVSHERQTPARWCLPACWKGKVASAGTE